MEREDIEKAAKDYSIGKTHFRRSVLKEVDADDYVLRKDNCREDFITGAEWRINSVWHDAKECPERKRNYLAQCKNGRFNVIPDSMNWDNFYKKAEIIRWAYIEDLLPNIED